MTREATQAKEILQTKARFCSGRKLTCWESLNGMKEEGILISYQQGTYRSESSTEVTTFLDPSCYLGLASGKGGATKKKQDQAGSTSFMAVGRADPVFLWPCIKPQLSSNLCHKSIPTCLHVCLTH